jgi:hypothetical protein
MDVITLDALVKSTGEVIGKNGSRINCHVTHSDPASNTMTVFAEFSETGTGTVRIDPRWLELDGVRRVATTRPENLRTNGRINRTNVTTTYQQCLPQRLRRWF